MTDLFAKLLGIFFLLISVLMGAGVFIRKLRGVRWKNSPVTMGRLSHTGFALVFGTLAIIFLTDFLLIAILDGWLALPILLGFAMGVIGSFLDGHRAPLRTMPPLEPCFTELYARA